MPAKDLSRMQLQQLIRNEQMGYLGSVLTWLTTSESPRDPEIAQRTCTAGLRQLMGLRWTSRYCLKTISRNGRRLSNNSLDPGGRQGWHWESLSLSRRFFVRFIPIGSMGSTKAFTINGKLERMSTTTVLTFTEICLRAVQQ